MNLAAVIDLAVMFVSLLVMIACSSYLWLDASRDRAEAELDRQEEEILRLAAVLSDDVREQGFDARRALIRAVQKAHNSRE